MTDLIDNGGIRFWNDDFSLQSAYEDCKAVFDGITDDNSFQECDTGFILCHAHEIMYALKKALLTAQPEQRWIPVSEGLPEDTAIVTVETKTFKYKYVCEAVWIPRWTWKAEYDNWEDCSEYNEDEDEYYVLEGWYERVYNWDEYSYVGIEDDVIAWMPLPKPYGGEQE